MPAGLQQVVQALYEAVIVPENWAVALHAFARATNSVGCLLYPRDQAQALVHLPVSPDIKDFIAAYVNEGWYLQDVRAARGWPQVAAGKLVLTDDDIAPPEERRSSYFFQEFHRAWELQNWAAIGFRANDGLWCMPLQRSRRQGPISPNQARELAAVSPHLGRVVELASLLDARRAAEHLAMLHLSGAAAVLLDWRGKISGLTRAAEALLGPDICVRSGALVAHHCRSNAALQKLISAASSGVEGNPGPQVAAIERQGHRPLVVKAIPLSGALAAVFGQARALLLFTDLDKRSSPIAEILRSAFGLTAAEARLAAEMASGDAVEDAAVRLGITKETARNHLKSIFQKTAVHRQSELVALMAKLPDLNGMSRG